MATAVHPVDEILPAPKMFALGLQHVLVMYAGAIAVPLIVGRALQLSPQDVAFLISADLFVCGIVSVMQSLGVGPWFGVKMPVMMGVTFASVGPMVSLATANPGPDGARIIFGAIIGAGFLAILIAPLMSRLLRFFPPVVTGTIILVIGISLMRVGINWIFGVPAGPTAPQIINPEHAAWLEQVKALGDAAPPIPAGLKLAATQNNPLYAPVSNIVLSAIVLAVVVLIARFAKGFLANVAVLAGIVVGAVIAAALGMMHFDKIAGASWFAPITPFHFGMPVFQLVPVITMTLVMIVVMIESTGMFLALSDMTGKKLDSASLSAGLRMDGLGTVIGGVFNTFPYTSFSQNVGLVGVTGVRSRFVCVTGGVIMIVLGLTPKMGALVESLPTVVLGGAGLVMFGMVAATGVRILSAVDFKTSRNNLFVVAISVGIAMIPLVAPNFKMWLPHAIDPLIESGILLAAISSVALNVIFNGAKVDEAGMREAAMAGGEH